MSAQPVELNLGIFRSIARQYVQVFDRQKELVVAMINQPQTIMRRALDGQGFQPVISSDTVIGVDHEVALCQGRIFGDEIFGSAPAATWARQPVAKNVLFAVQNSGFG